MCGYACINCGRCKGETRYEIDAGTCFFCGAVNPADAEQCSSCGKKLAPPPGEVVRK